MLLHHVFCKRCDGVRHDDFVTVDGNGIVAGLKGRITHEHSRTVAVGNAAVPIIFPGDDTSHIIICAVDGYRKAGKIHAAEQLPGQFLVQDHTILHQIGFCQIAARAQLQRMKAEIVSAYTDDRHLCISPFSRYGKRSLTGIGIGIQAAVFRSFQRCIGQLFFQCLPKAPDILLFQRLIIGQIAG